MTRLVEYAMKEKFEICYRIFATCCMTRNTRNRAARGSVRTHIYVHVSCQSCNVSASSGHVADLGISGPLEEAVRRYADWLCANVCDVQWQDRL